MAKKIKTYTTDFEILSLLKGKTSTNQTYYNIETLDKRSGEIFEAFYFGNTKPQAVISITDHTSKEGKTYRVATIQPHQSRNKFGRFTSKMRT